MTTTGDYVINPEDRFQTFFADLESRNHKPLLTTITDLHKTLITNITSLDLKSQTLDTQIQSFSTIKSESFLSLQNRENAIPERESVMASRVEELKNSAICDIEMHSERTETNLSESLRGFFRRMDSGGLMRFLSTKRKESVAALRTEMNEAVGEAVDLLGFVLDTVEEFVRMKVQGKVGLADRQWACGVLIQAALPVVGLTKEEGKKAVELGAGAGRVAGKVKERATGVLKKWKGVLWGGGGSGGVEAAAEATMFLQMVIGFGLNDEIEEGFLRELVMEFATRQDMAKLAVALGIGDKMGGCDFDLNSQMNLPDQNLGSTSPGCNFQVDDEDDSPIEEVTPLARKRRKIYKKWDYFEEMSLINAWLNVPKYPTKVKDEECRTFWQRILDYHGGSGKYCSRTSSQLKKHWGDISRVVAKFARVHSTIAHRNQHGHRADLIMSEAFKLYFTETGKEFRHEFAWRLLKDEQKFHDLMGAGELARKSKRTKVSHSGVYTSESNDEDAEVSDVAKKNKRTKVSQTGVYTSKSDGEDIEVSEVHTMECPFKPKTAKRTVVGKELASEVEESEGAATTRVERYNVAKKVDTMVSLSEIIEQQKEAHREREHFMRLIVLDTSKMDPVQKQAYYCQLEKFSSKSC